MLAQLLTGILAVLLLGGCIGDGRVSGPAAESSIEGTWIQTRVEFHKSTANGLTPFPIHSTFVNGDTLRSHVLALDTVLSPLFFNPFKQSLVRISENLVVHQGAFGHWAFSWNWIPEGQAALDSTTFTTTFAKLGGSRWLLNGKDSVSCARSGAELEIRFRRVEGISDSVVITAYYKPYAGAFPYPVLQLPVRQDSGLGNDATLDSALN